MENYYKILGVESFATKPQIKKNYLRLIKEVHPDTFKGDKKYAENMCAKLNVAYAVLSKDLSKSAYDRKLKEYLKEPGFSAVNKPTTVKDVKKQNKALKTQTPKPFFNTLQNKQELSKAESWFLRMIIVALIITILVLIKALFNASK